MACWSNTHSRLLVIVANHCRSWIRVKLHQTHIPKLKTKCRLEFVKHIICESKKYWSRGDLSKLDKVHGTIIDILWTLERWRKRHLHSSCWRKRDVQSIKIVRADPHHMQMFAFQGFNVLLSSSMFYYLQVCQTLLVTYISRYFPS